MKRMRCFIAIDGNNLYHKFKELGFKNQLLFDYKRFVEFLAGDKEIIGVVYYIGAVREDKNNPKTKKLLANQQKLLARLKAFGFHYELGYLLKTDKFREKGVDVKISVDVVRGAYKNHYDHLILVSSDTDLMPALREAIENKKTVEYIGFSHSPSYALIRHSSETRLLKREDLVEFFKKK